MNEFASTENITLPIYLNCNGSYFFICSFDVWKPMLRTSFYIKICNTNLREIIINMFFWKVFCDKRKLKLIIAVNIEIVNFLVFSNKFPTFLHSSWLNFSNWFSFKSTEFGFFFGRNIECRLILYTIFKSLAIVRDATE